MSTTYGALIVFGSGPGVGRNVAALFAERGFSKIILISRDATRLSKDAEFVRSAGGAGIDIHEIPTDLGNADHVQESLKKVEESLLDTPLHCVVFNAARLGRSDFFTFTPEDLNNDLQIAVVSLYTVARWALPRLLESTTSAKTTPSLVVTSGMLAKEAFPAMFSLAACKAAQYSLVQSLHKEFEPKGVHCALSIIAGTVSDESKVTNARNIANEIWTIFQQPRKEGKLEVTIEDPAYLEHVKNRERK